MRRSGPRIGRIVGTIAAAAILGTGLIVLVRAWPRGDAGALIRARDAYARHDWNTAAIAAREAVKIRPDDTEALRLLARASQRLGRDASANAMFHRLGSEALQAEDDFLLGVGLTRAGRSAAAIRMWEKALALEPDHAEALDALARAYAAGNRPDEAARLAERLAHRPGWEFPGELMWGSLRFELEDPGGAADLLSRALDRPAASRLDAASTLDYRKMLVRALLRAGRTDDARRRLQALPDADADGDPELTWLHGRASLLAGDIPAATAAIGKDSSYRSAHRMEPEPSPYSGESRCAGCHAEIARKQQSGRHASTLVRGAELTRLPYPDGPIPDPDDPAVTHRFRREGESVRFESQSAGAVRSALIRYAFGSPDHYTSPVGPDDSGRDYIIRLSHYARGRESGWVRTTGHSAHFSGSRDYLGKPLNGPDGLYRCLFCHATNPRSVLEGTGAVSRDRAIGCERCHGPGESHIRAIAAKLSDLAIVNPASGTGEERMRLCGQCHSQHLALPAPPPRTDPYWIRFQGTTLAWSRCFTESTGMLDCITCHDPHHEAKRTEAEHVARCLECHAPPASPRKRAPSGSSALGGAVCPVNPRGGCVACHMPSYESAPLHATFTDHYIRVHPDRKP